MKILLINPGTAGYTRSGSAPLGLLSIATYLQTHGHSVKIYDRTVTKKKLNTVLSEFKPKICGISLVSYKSVIDTLKVAEKLKKHGLPVILGGTLPSVLTEQSLKHDFFDIISLGEGEETWLELADYYDGKIKSLNNIAGLAYRDSNGKTVYTAQRAFMDLSKIPPLDWTLVDVPKYFQSSYGCKRMLYLYAAKGCPFACTFCYNNDFHKSTYRKRPLEILLTEIKFLVKNYGLDGVYFADEMWCTSKKEMHEICDSLRALNLNFVWGCQTRIGVFAEEDFQYMHNSGCRWVFFGVESGSKRMLEAINKKINYDKIVDTFAACRKANIASIGSFIVGLPDETVEDLKKTADLINQIDTSLTNMNYLSIIPGTQMYKNMVKSGACKEVSTLMEFTTQGHIEKMKRNFSKIPSIDIEVVRAYFMWQSFTANDVPGTENFGLAKKVITDAFKSIASGNFIGFTISTFNAGREFLKTAFYAHAFPKIKKKYGLK